MAAHPVDIHVGNKLKARRVSLGMSQDELGKALGITFQQIQKYERGVNRIGCSRLYDISKVLHMPVTYFFEGINSTESIKTKVSTSNKLSEASSSYEIESAILNKEISMLVRDFKNIKESVVKKSLLNLIKTLSNNRN